MEHYWLWYTSTKGNELIPAGRPAASYCFWRGPDWGFLVWLPHALVPLPLCHLTYQWWTQFLQKNCEHGSSQGRRQTNLTGKKRNCIWSPNLCRWLARPNAPRLQPSTPTLPQTSLSCSNLDPSWHAREFHGVRDLMAWGELHRWPPLFTGEGVTTRQRRRDAREGRELREAARFWGGEGVLLWLIVSGGLMRGNLVLCGLGSLYLYVNGQRIYLQHMHVYLPENFATNMYIVAEYVLLYGGCSCSASC
jgi:hypothetical protein